MIINTLGFLYLIFYSKEKLYKIRDRNKLCIVAYMYKYIFSIKMYIYMHIKIVVSIVLTLIYNYQERPKDF